MKKSVFYKFLVSISVVHQKGALLSEGGYYPFGLAINALASHAGAVTPNAYKYNSGTELTEDLDVDYYETYMRQYDAQTGRFTGVDALSEASYNVSNYAYADNDPIYFNDPSGAMMAAPAGPSGISQFEWDNLLYDAGYGYNSNFSFEWSSFGGGGGGGGSSSTQTYHYHYFQLGDLTDEDKKPRPGTENPDIKTDYKNTQDAYNKFSWSFDLGAAYGGDLGLMLNANALKQNFDYGHGGNMNMTGSDIAQHVFNSPEFKDATKAFEEEARQSYKDNGNSLDKFNGNLSLQTHHPSYFSPLNDLALTTVIGGYKAFFATVNVQNNNLSFTYSLFDTFGAGTDGSKKWYIPGLEPMYYLEKYGHMPGYTFMPFLWFFLLASPN